jgi:hypothetical protein
VTRDPHVRLRPQISCHAAPGAAFAGQEVTMLGWFRMGGMNMWFLAVLGAVMLWTAIQFARNADPNRLAILRALTVAIAAAATIGFTAGLIRSCQAVPPTLPEGELVRLVLAGFAESCANLVLGGAFVVISWVLVAGGVRRMPRDA